MGQSSSTERHTSWPEVQSLEQFKTQFRYDFSACIFPPEKEWLSAVTDKFGASKDGSTYWSERTIITFFSITLPAELHPQLKIASPLLYRCILRIGSFPYLNQPDAVLTNDVLNVALSILLQRHRELGRPVGVHGRTGGLQEESAHGMRSLLFQSMRVEQSTAPTSKERTEQDDEYLLQAHSFVDHLNNIRPESNPTLIVSGPPIISAEQLPSSNSADYGGAIPRDQFTSLIQICLYLNRHSKRSNSSMDEVKVPGYNEDIRWEAFEAYFSSAKGTYPWGTGHPVLNGLAVLMSPLISSTVSSSSLEDATRAEAEEMIRKAGPPNLEW